MPALTDHDLDSLATELSQNGCPPSHAHRLLSHFYAKHGSLNLAEIRVGKRVESLLETALPVRQSHIITESRSADGTTKFLVGFNGGGAVETVLMPWHRDDRAAGCVSSQIGCAMGCDFCASTKRGLERNLTAGEIIEQFLHLRKAAAAMGRRLSSLVFMGMGEPMFNLPNVLAALRRITCPGIGALGARHITVSTVGIVPGIDALAAAGMSVHLALSLHAPDDATRARLVPMNRRYPVAEIMAAARRYYERVGRIVTIEYCMLAGVNDTDDHARMLAEMMRGFRAHVNLIPYNPIGAGLTGKIYQRPSAERVTSFLNFIRNAGVVSHARDTRGDDVNAACGQLAQTAR